MPPDRDRAALLDLLVAGQRALDFIGDQTSDTFSTDLKTQSAVTDTSTTRRFGGSGLGLAIASRLVDQMDGRIQVESEVDRGSTFRFTVRLAPTEEALPPAHTTGSVSAALKAAARPLRVLVAEDNAINQRLVQAILGQRGHKIVMTANGREALAALDGEAFDVILMDVQMPVMDGFQATAAIRAREEPTGARIPIIALTAHAFKEDRERCLAAGMDGYLAKPIRFEELVELVENVASLRSLPPPPASPLGGIGMRKELTALFVEDAAKIGGEIRAAVARKDGPALQGAAHRLRGTAGYFGADRALELTARLEQLGRQADFSAETARLSQLLSDEIAQLQRAVTTSAD